MYVLHPTGTVSGSGVTDCYRDRAMRDAQAKCAQQVTSLGQEYDIARLCTTCSDGNGKSAWLVGDISNSFRDSYMRGRSCTYTHKFGCCIRTANYPSASSGGSGGSGGSSSGGNSGGSSGSSGSSTGYKLTSDGVCSFKLLQQRNFRTAPCVSAGSAGNAVMPGTQVNNAPIVSSSCGESFKWAKLTINGVTGYIGADPSDASETADVRCT